MSGGLVSANRKTAASLLGNFEIDQHDVSIEPALVVVAQVLMNLDEFGHA